MTREEAIDYIREWCPYDRQEEIIKALEQKPTTKNDLGVDCIVDVLGSYTDLDIPYKREIAENILTKLSSVTPQEPKKGHWIRFKEFEDGYYHIKCSECGQYWSIDGHAKTFKYCFKCGAKMESEELTND